MSFVIVILLIATVLRKPQREQPSTTIRLDSQLLLPSILIRFELEDRPIEDPTNILLLHDPIFWPQEQIRRKPCRVSVRVTLSVV